MFAINFSSASMLPSAGQVYRGLAPKWSCVCKSKKEPKMTKTLKMTVLSTNYTKSDSAQYKFVQITLKVTVLSTNSYKFPLHLSPSRTGLASRSNEWFISVEYCWHQSRPFDSLSNFDCFFCHNKPRQWRHAYFRPLQLRYALISFVTI